MIDERIGHFEWADYNALLDKADRDLAHLRSRPEDELDIVFNLVTTIDHVWDWAMNDDRLPTVKRDAAAAARRDHPAIRAINALSVAAKHLKLNRTAPPKTDSRRSGWGEDPWGSGPWALATSSIRSRLQAKSETSKMSQPRRSTGGAACLARVASHRKCLRPAERFADPVPRVPARRAFPGFEFPVAADADESRDDDFAHRRFWAQPNRRFVAPHQRSPDRA